MTEHTTKEEVSELRERVTDLEIGDRKFQARCYQEFASIHRQLADHGNVLKNLEDGQNEIKNILGQLPGLVKKAPQPSFAGSAARYIPACVLSLTPAK